MSRIEYDVRSGLVIMRLVLEAKVNRIGKSLLPTPRKPLDQFGCCFKYITSSAQGVDVQNLISVNLAIATLRLCEKNGFRCWFFVSISVLRLVHRSHFSGYFNA